MIFKLGFDVNNVNDVHFSDLQFQLVMQGVSTKLKPASPETSEPAQTTPMPTPMAANVTTVTLLQTQSTSPELENLENNIKKLEADLHEARSRNIYLSDLVDTQKRLEFIFNFNVSGVLQIIISFIPEPFFVFAKIISI